MRKHWVLGTVVFLAAATMLFEAAGQPSPRPVVPVLNAYRPAAIDDPGVKTALNFALSDQKRRNRSAPKVLSVLSAERQTARGENLRLCLSIDRRGRPDTARVVVHRNQKDRLSVALWAWGACGKS